MEEGITKELEEAAKKLGISMPQIPFPSLPNIGANLVELMEEQIDFEFPDNLFDIFDENSLPFDADFDPRDDNTFHC